MQETIADPGFLNNEQEFANAHSSILPSSHSGQHMPLQHVLLHTYTAPFLLKMLCSRSLMDPPSWTLLP